MCHYRHCAMDLDAMGCEEAQGIEEKPEAGAAFRRERFPKGLGGGAGGVSSLIAAPATRTTSRRHEARIIPVVPHKANKKQKPGFFAKALYRGRARITEDAPASNRLSASSNASNASPYDARRRSEISHPLRTHSRLHFGQNPSTPPIH
ncbi:hypothetical protein [Sinorhizobium fredii]|uniref:hypothetical protein n=1 Tax=Rhizobium fredii TaxID=380 RepID=UPI0012FDCD48|nr:hypothetical protein [Sinorhizobium fredii]